MSGTTQQAGQPSYSLNLDWLVQDIKKNVEESFSDYTKSVREDLISRNPDSAKGLDKIMKRSNYYINVDDEPIKTYMDRFKEVNYLSKYLIALAYTISALQGQLKNTYGQQRRMIEEELGKLLSVFKYLVAARNNVDADLLSDQDVSLELSHYASLASGLAAYLREKLKDDYLKKGGNLYRVGDIYELGNAIHSLFTKLMSDAIILLYDRLLRDGYLGPKLIAKVVANIIKQNPDMIYNFSSEAFKNLYSKYVTSPSTTQPTQGQQIPQQVPQTQQIPQQTPASQQAQQPPVQPQQQRLGGQTSQGQQLQNQPQQSPSGQQAQGQQISQTQGQSQQGQQGQKAGP